MAGSSEDECPWPQSVCDICEALGICGEEPPDGPPDDPDFPDEPDEPDPDDPYDDSDCMEWVWDELPLVDPTTGEDVPGTGSGHWKNICYC